MALVSGGSSRLNPNAQLYIPAAVRKVEDFSPEWYDMISTSTWYRDYWLSQRQEAATFSNHHKLDNNLDNNKDIVDMLPDDIDFGIEEDTSYMGSNFQEIAPSYGRQPNKNILANENVASKNIGLPRVSFPPGSKFAAQPVNVQGKSQICNSPELWIS